MQSQNDYPGLVCFNCCRQANGKIPCMATYHLNICEVCNKWRSVTHPRNYGYPELKINRNREEIIKELTEVISFYEKTGDFYSSNLIRNRIEDEKKT